MFGAARPAGPCAFYPMNDSWTDRALRARSRADRRRRRVERPDHRSGPRHRAARCADRHRCRAQRAGLVCGGLCRLRRGAPRADAPAAGGRSGDHRYRRPHSLRPVQLAAGPTTPSGRPIRCSAVPGSLRWWVRTTCLRTPSPSPPSTGSSRSRSQAARAASPAWAGAVCHFRGVLCRPQVGRPSRPVGALLYGHPDH